jgi:hypothetical protein
MTRYQRRMFSVRCSRVPAWDSPPVNGRCVDRQALYAARSDAGERYRGVLPRPSGERPHSGSSERPRRAGDCELSALHFRSNKRKVRLTRKVSRVPESCVRNGSPCSSSTVIPKVATTSLTSVCAKPTVLLLSIRRLGGVQGQETRGHGCN